MRGRLLAAGLLPGRRLDLGPPIAEPDDTWGMNRACAITHACGRYCAITHVLLRPRPFLAWRFAFLASICAHSRASRCSSSDGAGFGAGCFILAGGGVEAACVGACTGRWASPSCAPDRAGRVCAGRSGVLVAASGQLAALGLGLRGLGLPPALQDRSVKVMGSWASTASLFPGGSREPRRARCPLSAPGANKG